MNVVTRPKTVMLARVVVVVGFAGLGPAACFQPESGLRGLPCTEDASCGSLGCSYGFCGGPPRCDSGAGVGDYCFAVDAEPIELGARVTAIAIGQIDADASPDLAVAAGNDGALILLANDRQGGVARSDAMATIGDEVTDLGIGALDEGGLADIVATTATRVVGQPVLGTAEAPTFGSTIAIAADVSGPRLPQIGSFVDDADRRVDIAVLVEDGFSVIAQTGPLSFGGPLRTPASEPKDLRSLGVAMERLYVAEAETESVNGYDRRSDGTFDKRVDVEVGVAPERFTMTDVDRDGFTDLLVAGADGTLWLTTGKNAAQDDWSMPQKVYSLGWRPNVLAAVNLDDDPEPEYVIAGESSPGTADVFLFDNDGDGKPIYGGSLGVGGAVMAVDDLDRDGVPEFVTGSEDGRLSVIRRTVAPPPPDGDESTSTGTGNSGDPSNPTNPSDPSDPSDPSASDPTIPGMTEPDSGSESGLPSCGDGGGFEFGGFCYMFEYLVEVGADARVMAVGDYSGDFEPDVLLATGDARLVGYSALGGANLLDVDIPTAGFADPIILPLQDAEGFWDPWIGAVDTVGLHLGRPLTGDSVDLPLDGAHSPIRLDFYDEMSMSYRPALLVATGQGIAAVADPFAGIAYSFETPAVGLASTSYGGEAFLVANGGDVRLFGLTYAGFGEVGPYEALGASTKVALGTAGVLAGVDGSTLRFIGYDYSLSDYVVSEIEGIGTVIGSLALVDLTGDGIEDLTMLQESDPGDGSSWRRLSVYRGTSDGVLAEENVLLDSITAFAIDQTLGSPAVYFTTPGASQGTSQLWRLRSDF